MANFLTVDDCLPLHLDKLRRVAAGIFNTRKRIAMALGVIFCTLLIMESSGLSEDTHLLRGLEGVQVIVEEIQSEVKGEELTKGQLKTDVEMALRLSGIKVLSAKERVKIVSQPILYLNVNVMKTQGPAYVFNVDLSSREGAITLRGGMTWAPTWEWGYVGMTTDVTSIRDYVKDVVDRFINAYLSANSK